MSQDPCSEEQPDGTSPSVRLLPWASDSRRFWFALDNRWFFRSGGTSARLVRELAIATGMDAFNPDRGLELSCAAGSLYLGDVRSGRSVLVARCDFGAAPRWNKRGAFSYVAGGTSRYVASANALLRWSPVELWLWS